MAYRMQQSSRACWGWHKLLTLHSSPLALRMSLLWSILRPSFLHGAHAWHVTSAMAMRMRSHLHTWTARLLRYTWDAGQSWVDNFIAKRRQA
eukprot:1843252-Amphidinium_carterae.1